LHHSGGSVLLGLVEADLPFLLVCIFAIIILLISIDRCPEESSSG
jgi:hypothetical protein